VGELLVADRRAEVGEQAQVLAQAQDGLLGAQRAFELVVLPVAHGAEQHGVGGLGQVQRAVGQRVAVGLVGGAADQAVSVHLELQVQHVQHLHGLGHDLGADAVTRQDGDLHVSFLESQAHPVRFVPARACAPALGLEGLDLVGVPQRQADVVEAVDQAVLAEGLHLEREFAAIGLDDHLARQVDGQLVAREGRHLVEQLVHLRSGSTMGSRPFLKQLLKKMSA
jgi:hypothetical protein